MRRRLIGALALAVLTVPFFGAAHAQEDAAEFPTRPVTLIVPFDPGGPTDTIGRLLAQGLSERWGQPVVVENMPGSGTMVANNYLANAEPDGYVGAIAITALYMNPAVRASMPYDTVEQLAGVTMCCSTQVVLTAGPHVPADDLAGLIEWAKEQPDGITYAVAGGTGSSTHLAGEMLSHMAGIEMRAIPYNGSAEGIADVQAGRVDVMFDPWPSARGQVEAGTLKLIANASTVPIEGVETDSIPEALPGYDTTSITGVIVPRGTPKPIVDKWSETLREVIASEDIGGQLREYGMIPMGSTAEEYDERIAAEIAKWSKVADDAGIEIK